MDRWDEADWEMRTGYVGVLEHRLVFQNRIGVQPVGPDNLDFYEFVSLFGFSWLNKPDWSLCIDE